MNQWSVIWSARQSFIDGLLVTLELFIIAAVAGLLLGLLLGALRHRQASFAGARSGLTGVSGMSECPDGPTWISVPICGHTPQS